MLVHRLRRWPNIKPTLSHCLVLAEACTARPAASVDKPHCVSHISWFQNGIYHPNLRPVRVVNDSCCKVTFQWEDIKTVAQLIEPTDDLVTVDIKN